MCDINKYLVTVRQTCQETLLSVISLWTRLADQTHDRIATEQSLGT